MAYQHETLWLTNINIARFTPYATKLKLGGGILENGNIVLKTDSGASATLALTFNYLWVRLVTSTVKEGSELFKRKCQNLCMYVYIFFIYIH